MPGRLSVLLGLLLLASASPLSGQGAAPVLRAVGPEGVLPGREFEVLVELEVPAGPGSMGWSFGLCNDPALFTCIDAGLGIAAATLENGTPIGFASAVVTPEGFTHSAVTSLSAPSLPPGPVHEIVVGRYAVSTGAPLSVASTIGFCESLEVAPGILVENHVVLGATAVDPIEEDLTLSVEATLPPQFALIAPDLTVLVDEGTGLATFELPLVIDQIETGVGDAGTDGFRLSLRELRSFQSVTGVALGFDPAPEFVQCDLGISQGWTLEVLFDLAGLTTEVLQSAVVVTATYETFAPFFLVTSIPQPVTPLAWTNSLPGGAVENAVIVSGGAVRPLERIDGSITYVIGSGLSPFRRGDGNRDGAVNIADALWILNHLFFGGPPGPCPIALDVDGDGGETITDAIALLGHLFQGAPPPPPPYPACGTVPAQQLDPSLCGGDGGC
ncbi:MAG: dockerin type I repeat-containing protein [Planctomycetota bacterium]